MIDELAVAHVLVAAVALISCLSVPDKRTIRNMPRALWVVAILLIPLAGSIGWFLAGRPHRIRPPRRWQNLIGLPQPPGPTAPEDDPEFLLSLEDPTTGRQQEQADPAQDDPHRHEDGQDRPGASPDG